MPWVSPSWSTLRSPKPSPRSDLTDLRRSRNALLAAVVLLGTFQAGRMAERWVWPCRLRPFASLVGPLLGQEVPDAELCALIERLPRF